MAKFEVFNGSGWKPISITDTRGTVNRLVTPETIGGRRLRAIGKSDVAAECVWTGTEWDPSPVHDHHAQYIANSINCANVLSKRDEHKS